MTLHSTLSIFATYWHAPHKKNLVPVFQKVDSAIHQINLYSVDWVQLVSLILVRWIEISPLDSVFSNILPNWISSCLLKCYLWQPFTILQCSRFCISLQQFSWASKVWIINKDEYNSNDFSHYRPKLFSFFYFLLHFGSESPSQAILFLIEWILITIQTFQRTNGVRSSYHMTCAMWMQSMSHRRLCTFIHLFTTTFVIFNSVV